LLSLVPNLLTLLRIAACPVLVLVLNARNYEVALLLFFFAGVTDALDGYIAKRFDCATYVGSILDPIADKLLITCAYVMLTILGDIPFYLLVVVIFRDLVIIGGYFIILLVTQERVPIQPIYWSKLNTFLQIFLVVVVLVESSGWLSLGPLQATLVLGVIVTSLVSGALYVWMWGFKRQAVGEKRP
jgi:cardiolipin synthase